jgi:hypothetical protein
MIQLKQALYQSAMLAMLSTAVTFQLQAGGIYLSAGSGAPGTSASAQYSSGPDVIPSTPNPGFFSTSSAGSTVSAALPIGLTLGSLSTTSAAMNSGTAVAYADVNLATGLMHLSDVSNGPLFGCGGTCAISNLNATSTAALTDLVTWAITDNAPTATVGVTFHVSGVVTTEAGASGNFSDHTCFSFGSVAFGFTGSNTGFATDPTACGAGGVGFTLTNQSATGFDANANMTVTNGMQSRLIAELQVLCANGDNCDFMHTGALSFTLPQDVTFSSSSGILLTQTAATQSPEPTTLALMGVSLLALAIGSRRSRTNS